MTDRPAQVEGDARQSRYLAEAYMPNARAEELAEAALRARSAASALTSEGRPITYLQSLLLAADETCFHIFEAPADELVWEASRRAGLAAERVVTVLEAGRDAGSH